MPSSFIVASANNSTLGSSMLLAEDPDPEDCTTAPQNQDAHLYPIGPETVCVHVYMIIDINIIYRDRAYESRLSILTIVNNLSSD